MHECMCIYIPYLHSITTVKSGSACLNSFVSFLSFSRPVLCTNHVPDESWLLDKKANWNTVLEWCIDSSRIVGKKHGDRLLNNYVFIIANE